MRLSPIMRSALFMATMLAAAAPARAAEGITVTIDAGGASDGQFLVALFNSADTFLKTPAMTQKVPVGGNPTATFTGVPAGNYAVTVIHDANGNGKMDRSLIGKPREAIGMSNNPKIRGSAPKFQEAMFSYDGKATTVAVTPVKP